MQQSGLAEEIERFAIGWPRVAFIQLGVFELFADASCRILKHAIQTIRRHPRRVFGKIVLQGQQDLLLRTGSLPHRASIPPQLERLGHATYKKVIPQLLQNEPMGGGVDRFWISRQRLGHDFLSHGEQILLKIHRTDPHVAQSTHRHRNVAERELQQRTSRHNVKLRHFLVKIPQRSQGTRTGLNLIQEKQGFPWHNLSSGYFQSAEDSGRIEIFIENRS